MNNLDSFDNNKIKCKVCGKYFDKESIFYDLSKYCEKCWQDVGFDKSVSVFRQSGKCMLSWNILNAKNEQT
jgi:hypothetical protein